MLKTIIFLLTLCCIYYCVATKNMTTDDMADTSIMAFFDRKPRANLVSFEPLGEHIKLGLDFLLPFLKVPIVRKVDAYGNEPALVNINTAALVSTGLLVTSSALISLIFRRYVLLGREESSSERRRRYDNILEDEILSILSNFKVIYTNSSGARVDTSLPAFLNTINKAFKKNDIELSSCLQKAICTRIQSAARRVNEGDSSGVDKIIDGLMGIEWLEKFLRNTSLKDAINSRNVLCLPNQQQNKIYCDIKFQQCKWSMPEDHLLDIIRSFLKFT